MCSWVKLLWNCGGTMCKDNLQLFVHSLHNQCELRNKKLWNKWKKWSAFLSWPDTMSAKEQKPKGGLSHLEGSPAKNIMTPIFYFAIAGNCYQVTFMLASVLESWVIQRQKKEIVMKPSWPWVRRDEVVIQAVSLLVKAPRDSSCLYYLQEVIWSWDKNVLVNKFKLDWKWSPLHVFG